MMHNLCRLCAKSDIRPPARSLTTLRSSAGMKSLIDFCLHGNEEHEFAATSPMLPTSVCDACLEQLNCFQQFVLSCRTAQLTLQQLISSEEWFSPSDDETMIVRDPESNPESTTVERRDRLEIEEEKCNNHDLEEAINDCSERPGVESRTDSRPHGTRSAAHDEPAKRRSTVANRQPPPSRRKQMCQVCGKVLSNKATFRVHMKIHTQDKSLICSICDRRFYVKQQLQIHMESLHEQKEFVCTVCGLKCRWRKSLARHMQLHAENPYKHQCDHCEKAFSRPNQLRIHTMKHTGDRVCCDLCGAGYMYNYMLTQHKIRKHGLMVEGVQLYERRRPGTQNKANSSTSQ
ncbi:zinc finger protein 260-like [Anopheles aquasalis]|uniref:zinc finger protein 260-like n=1 Tax=Anopheles aquasalis TaxID=42839 RepID=UPI00215B3C39|nr:zinc finger protein 260-like [Anopheles aquasalis]